MTEAGPPVGNGYGRFVKDWLQERSRKITSEWVGALDGADPSAHLDAIASLVESVAAYIAGGEDLMARREALDEVRDFASERRCQGLAVFEVLEEWDLLIRTMGCQVAAATSAFPGGADPEAVVSVCSRLTQAGAVLGIATARSYRAYTLRSEQDSAALLSSYGAMLSHELGNRLGAAETAVKLLRSDMVLGEDKRTRLEELIQEGIERGLEVVNDVRLLAAPAEGRDGAETISLRLLMKELARQARMAVSEEPVTIELDKGIPDVRVPAGYVRMAVANVLDHAVRYGRQEGREDPRAVRLRGFLDDGRVRLAVEDDGPGVTSSVWDSLVTRPYRPSRGGEDRETLGLAVAADSLSKLGGELSAGQGPDGTFQVVIELPVGKK